LYNHKARRKDSNPVLFNWNFKKEKTQTSYNQKLHPAKSGKLCRQTLGKSGKKTLNCCTSIVAVFAQMAAHLPKA